MPDPKLPTMDVYIVPKHIWEDAGTPTTSPPTTRSTASGSGPFTLKERKASQEWTMVANPNYWKGEPAVDQVVFRVFSDGERDGRGAEERRDRRRADLCRRSRSRT